jgi:hypothetical protein
LAAARRARAGKGRPPVVAAACQGLARPEALFTYVSPPSARSRICPGQLLPLHGTLRAEGLPPATSLLPTKTPCAWNAPSIAYQPKRAAAHRGSSAAPA